jgi:hypothetical protein
LRRPSVVGQFLAKHIHTVLNKGLFMQNLDFGKFKIPPPHPALLGDKTQLEPLQRIPSLKLEEEEENSYSIPDSEAALKYWWAKFNQFHKYPLYCMILATSADENISMLIDEHRQELAEIAGDKCCLIYFRDIEKAKLLEPFQFTEHAKGVMQLIKLVTSQRIKNKGLPKR